MAYVERRDEVIVGVYANAQPGYAEEEVADNHPDVVAFLNPPPRPPIRSAALKLLDALVDEGIIPPGRKAAIESRL